MHVKEETVFQPESWASYSILKLIDLKDKEVRKNNKYLRGFNSFKS